jgi:hypothetical protein
MSDETFAAPTSSQPGAMTPTSEEDYDAICAAVMETVRGRWFLNEYSRRNRHADTQLILAALDRIEAGLRGEQTPQSIERLRHDLMEMAKAIARAQHEIAGIAPGGENPAIGDVTLELDSVMRATDEATTSILAAAAQIQEIAWTMREQGNDVHLVDQLDTYAANIQTAASSQKLAGERTQKVVHVMRYLEGRINDMIDVWGGYPAVDNKLLANSAANTPALPPADIGHAEVSTTTNPDPTQNSSDQLDANSLPTAAPEASRLRQHLNDNGGAVLTNGHTFLDRSIEAAIKDAATITNALKPEANGKNETVAAEIADDDSQPRPNEARDTASGDGKNAQPSELLESDAPQARQKLRDLQEPYGHKDLEDVAKVEAPEDPSGSRLAEPESHQLSPHSDLTTLIVSPDGDGGTASLPRKSSAAPRVVVSQDDPLAKAGAAGAMAPALESGIVISNQESDPTADALASVATKAAPTRAEVDQESLTLGTSGESQTTVGSAVNGNDPAPASAIVATAAEPDQEPKPLIETQPDAQGSQDAEGASVKARPFVVFELELEPLPTGLEDEAPPLPKADAKGPVIAATVELAARSTVAQELGARPAAAETTTLGWLAEPDTTLHHIPPRAARAEQALQPSIVASAVTASTATEAPQARPSQPDLPSPVVFLTPLEAKPVSEASTQPAAVVAPTEADAAAPAISAPAGASGSSAPAVAVKPTPSSATPKLRPPPPSPQDPLAAIAALSDEEKIALFS